MTHRFLLLSFAILLGTNHAFCQDVLDYESEPISYSKRPANNAIERLNTELKSGRLKLSFNEKWGYLPAVLGHLRIPVSSQVFTFGQTSIQADQISPKTPRAIYYSDDVFLGYVQGQGHGGHGPVVLEVGVSDPALGAVFYTLLQTESELPQFSRQSNRCMTCHGGPKTRGVPGFQVRSIIPDPNGRAVLAAGNFRTDHSSPLSQRWGGWYVTGTHGDQIHLGNFHLPTSKKPKKFDNPAGQNLKDLSEKFDVKAYLSPHSDLVALMLLEHQVDAANYLTRVNFEHQLFVAAKGDGKGFADAVEHLVRHFLFSGEAKLTADIRGTSAFEKEFSQRGPFDKSGRSFRTFDLINRLFKYPMSYMIYSSAFDSLHPYIKSAVYRRLWDVLRSTESGPDYSNLTEADRVAIREILIDTKSDLPAYWTEKSGR